MPKSFGILMRRVERFNLPATSLAVCLLAVHPAMGQTTDTTRATEEDPVTADIVVTGSRLGDAGFNAPTPVTVIGAEEIQRQAATTVSEVFNKIPAFRSMNTSSTNAIYASNIGATTADLRALGANRTLVLIDGRRVVAATTQGGSMVPANVVDLNQVPTSLVGRAEVVTGGASAAYGSDAVAGVVNIILDKQLRGFRGSMQYGVTELGDNKEYAISLAYGAAVNERGSFIIGGDFSDAKGAGDCYSRDWCLPGRAAVSNPNRNNGLPATILLPMGSIATATKNGIITAGPLAGQEFAPDGLSTYAHNYGVYYGAGLFQSGGGDMRHPFYENIPLAAPTRRITLLGALDYELTDSIKLIAEFSYANVKASTIGAQTRDTGSIIIQRDNPFLPSSVVTAMTTAGVSSFNFGRIGQDLGPATSKVERATTRIVGGLEGTLPNGWKWNAYYQYGRTDYSQRQQNTRINDNFTRAVDAVRAPNGSVVCRINADANPANDDPACSPLNLFGQYRFSPAAKAYTYGLATQDTTISQHVAAATLSGNLAELWAGPLSFAVGGEYRNDRAFGTADPISTALRFYTSPGAPIDGEIDVKEGFVELGLPLARGLTLLHSLDVNGAVRVTDYSTSGSVTTWKVGATWEPARQLRLRVTRSRDIRAPNVFELYGPRQTSFQTISDPTRGNASVLPLSILGGNADLKPEVADTFTAGVVFQPDFLGLDRLRVSVDYYDIDLQGAISTLGSQLIVNLCAAGRAELCAQVTRDANGVITSVSNTNLNLNRVQTRGVDIELAYNMPLFDGRISTRLLATHVMNLKTTDQTGTVIDRAGQMGPPTAPSTGGLPKWSGTAQLTYEQGPFSISGQMRYISRGVRDVLLVGPDDPRYSTTRPDSVNLNRVRPYAYLNLNAQYAILDDGARKIELFGAVSNVLNTDPPNYLPLFSPTNPVLYDMLGRSYRIGARFAF
ncbi:TonB-dependent receptor plug domain-containing protein [Sphingomonas turrisvirgatae]|nr:TonB-dependent receptor [Sphingomonas turrisvirgatae]